MTTIVNRRLWQTAGCLAIASIVLTFVGNAFEHSLMLGDKPSAATAALIHSSMAKNFAGGYVELLSFLVFLVGALLLARLLRGKDEVGAWLSSCMTASATVYVAVTIATGFAAGAAALYDGHHGASLATATTVNDIRNFGFLLCSAVVGIFVLATAAAAHRTGLLPRWIYYTGYAVGILAIAAVPASRTGVANLTTMLWFVWFVALGVVALRQGRRTAPALPPAASVPA